MMDPWPYNLTVIVWHSILNHCTSVQVLQEFAGSLVPCSSSQVTCLTIKINDTFHQVKRFVRILSRFAPFYCSSHFIPHPSRHGGQVIYFME